MPRHLPLVLVALLAASAALWMLWPTAPGDLAGYDAAVTREGGPGGEEASALLRGAGEGASTIPVELRGRGGLVGRVRQGGVGRAATVGVYLVETFTGADPLGMWRGRSFLQRIFDGGVASGRALATTRTDADGAFGFDGLTAGTYELRATAEDGARARSSVSIPGAGARVEAVLDLPVGGERLRGRVVHADGKSFEGFVIVSPGADMESFFAPVEGSLVATPDREGRFVVGGLPAGPVVLSAVVPGRLRAIGAPVVLPREDEFVLTLGADAKVQRGRVLDAADSTPIEGASVTAGAGGPSSGFLLVRVASDAEGRFEVAVPEGDGGLFVEAAGYAPYTGEWAGAGAEVEIRLLRTARLTGRVVHREGGEGVENAWVFALPLERGFSLAFPAAARTNASGRFELAEIVPGAVTVFAMGGGWVTPGLGKVEPDGYNPLARTLAPGESQEVELEVEPAGRLEGRVTRQTGRPVAGAVLRLKSPFFAFRTLALAAIFGGGVGSAVADADGRYAIDTLVPQVDYRLEATAVASPPYRSDTLRVEGGKTERLDVVLDAPRWLDLRVTSSDGSALAAAKVTAGVTRSDGTDYEAVSGRWHTGADGRVRVGPLPPGVIGVQVEAADHLEPEGWIEVADGATTGDIAHELTLERGLRIGGTVVVPEGASPRRVEISIQSRRVGRGTWVWEHTSPMADGTWSFGGLPAGGLEIEAELQWEGQRYAATTKIEAGDESIRLELEAMGSSGKGLVVKILDADGNPVPAGNVRMVTRSENSSGTHGQSFSNGQVTFEGAEDEEEVWVQAWAPAGSGWGDALVGPIPERSGEIVVRLPRARTIEGVVLDAQGKGVGGIRVQTHWPSPLGERNFGRGDRFSLTAEDGSFRLLDLGEGTYPVLVKAPDTYAPVAPVEAEGGARGLRIVLTPAASATLTIVDYEGKPVRGARVSLSIEDESEIHRHAHDFESDAQGIAHARGLSPAAAYTLGIGGPEDRDDLRPYVAKDWTPASGSFRLEQAYVIAGIVRDLSGRPVPSVWVHHGTESEPGHWSGTLSEADGTFRITGLEKGAYRVRAQVGPRLGAPMPGQEASFLVVQAGTSDVVLKIDPGITLRIRVKPWTGGEWGNAMQLREQHEGGGWSFTSEDVDGEGRVAFRGCTPGGRYDVFLGGLPGRQYVLGRDVKPGPEEIVLAPQTGGTITGRLHLPTGVPAKHRFVSVRVLRFHVSGTVEEDGSFALHGLPPGTWVVQGGMRTAEGAYYWGSVQASAGADVDVQLESR